MRRALIVLLSLLLLSSRAKGEPRQLEPDTFIELRAGPYYPKIDAEFDGSTPFRDTFGSESRLMLGVSYDRELFEVGELASFWFGVGAAYTRFSTDALLADRSGKRVEEETYLALLPVHALVALRATGLAALQVPTIPYSKLGLGCGLWWSRTSDGQTAGESRTARGASFGPHVAFGALLPLDALDPGQAAVLRAASGVEHSYLLFEWYTSGLGLFDERLRVGASSWAVGLALEL
jgi:hypothetical protein